MTCFGKRTLLCAEPLDCLRTLLCAEPLDCLRTLLCAEPLDCLRTCPVPDPCLPDDPPPCRLPSSGPRLLSWITDWLWWQRRPAAPFPSPLTNKSLFKLYLGVEIDFVAFSPVNTPKHLECVTYGGECGHRILTESNKSTPIKAMESADLKALLAQLVANNQQLVVQNQQQQIRHEEAMQAHLRCTEEQRRQHVHAMEIQAHTTELLQAELKVRRETQEEWGFTERAHRANPAGFLTKQTPSDDIEAFLGTFERTAEREGWPTDQWVGLIAPFLSGIAQTTYQDTASDPGLTYTALKSEILQRYGFNLITRAQRWHEWTFDPAASPRAQMHELVRRTNAWLVSEPKSLPPMERMIMDRFMRALPYEAKKLACQNNPQSADQLVDLMEGYQAAQGVLRSGRPPKPEAAHPQNPEPRRAAVETQRRRPLVNPDRRRCYECGETGHLAWNCPQVRDVPMLTAASETPTGRPCGLLTTCWAEEGGTSPSTPVTANGQDTTALLDSGSMVTLIRPEFAQLPHLEGTLGVTCIHGETRQYPTTMLHLRTTKGSYSGPVGIVPNLPVPVLIGRDLPLFRPLWFRLATGTQRTPRGPPSPQRARPRPSPPPFCGFQEVDPQASTDPLAEEESSADRAEEEAGYVENEGPPQGAEEADLGDLFPLNPAADVPPLAEPLAGRFGSAQLEDPNLARALQQVAVVDGQLINGVRQITYPHFAIKNALLYQVIQKSGVMHELLLVPRPFIPSVLRLAHSHQLGAHLGVEKTLERIKARFYWPGVKKAVEDFCRSCPECQQVAPRPHHRNPLIPLPIITVPFNRIGMDLVGPLPKSARGHQYILVILDYATRYPEAIPLRTMASKNIARELVMMFSRVGIPEEILTDQGTPFMSRIMKDLCKLLKITQLRTSVYHPQTDGLVERFNQTLKQMLRKIVEADGRNWDQLLPYLLFSIREVPQASTGFSPFELLYGRQPRGLLDLAKEAWEQQPSPHRSLVEHVEEVQERMAVLWPMVREHMAAAQAAQARVYNRGAQPRVFAPGDRVLVLVPTSECKFLAKWHGPYEVIEKVGEVNYRISQPGRRPPEKIYHVNLLKKWVAREALCAISLPQGPTPTETLEVPMGEQLSGWERQNLRELIDRHRDVFSVDAGHTDLLQHHIITEPGKRVKLRPYRIPEARREAVRQEVKSMLQNGIIEESHSEWCSPIVLVPKPDGSIRFCNDFRKLNEISKFDAYPMPRVDELIERLGKARYISTLDLTKGYWQVPLAPTSKEKTAFATPDGLFQYRMLPFGLHGAPATFQRLMDRVLRPHREYAAAYLDDIVIHGEEWGTHLKQVTAVLRALRGAGLTANPKKCRLGLRDANYLGYTIGRGCVKPQAGKAEAIREWPRPQTKKQVRTFVGLASYYRRFVPHFASLSAPLTDLTKSRLPDRIQWTEETEKAFQGLKEALCSGPVLVTPDFTKPLVVQTDASETGVGAVLSQLQEGEEHPIIYISRKLLPREKKYSTIEKECLAIKWALEVLKYYLLGRHFTLVTDHAPLVWMSRNKETNARVTRWFLSLQPFAFSVVHRSGAAHGNADALSRRDALGGWAAPPSRSELRGRVCDSRQRSLRGEVREHRYVPFPTFTLMPKYGVPLQSAKVTTPAPRWQRAAAASHHTDCRGTKGRDTHTLEESV